MATISLGFMKASCCYVGPTKSFSGSDEPLRWVANTEAFRASVAHSQLQSGLVDKLEANGVALRILDFSGNAVDTRGATGRLMLNMFAQMAQFEREMMLERQREGIAKAKAQGSTRRRLKMRFASLRRAKRSLTSRVSWESGVEAPTAQLKARVKPVRA
jgi:hypothetical protein